MALCLYTVTLFDFVNASDIVFGCQTFFNYVYACLFSWGFVYVSAGPEKRVLNNLELKLQVVVVLLTWVLGTKFGSFYTINTSLNC